MREYAVNSGETLYQCRYNKITRDLVMVGNIERAKGPTLAEFARTIDVDLDESTIPINTEKNRVFSYKLDDTHSILTVKVRNLYINLGIEETNRFIHVHALAFGNLNLVGIRGDRLPPSSQITFLIDYVKNARLDLDRFEVYSG